MPEYLAPGVYIEEFEIGARPIEGVSTSTAGFLGQAERGQTVPRLITSFPEYQRVFGSYFGATQYLPYAVQGFFDNGGQRCYIARIVGANPPANAVSASLQLTDTAGANALTVNTVGEGGWGNRVVVKVSPGTFGGIKLNVYYWREGEDPSPLYDPEVDATTTPRPAVEEVFDDLSVDEASPDYYEKKVNGISNLIEISGSALPIVGHSGTAQAGGAQSITLASSALSTDDAYNGMFIEITGGTASGETNTITDYDGTTQVATVNAAWVTAPDDTSEYRVSIHGGTAQDGAAQDIILAANASASDDFYNGMAVEITGGTGAGQLRIIADYDGATQVATVDANWDTVPDATSEYRIYWLNTLANGAETSPIVLADYLRTDTDAQPDARKGLTGLGAIDDISILYAPNANDSNLAGLVGALITNCENLTDRFAIIDSAQAVSRVSTLDPRSSNNTQYAAFYYPWIKVIDPAAGVQRTIPSGGHIAGIYARTDTNRGVHKAPANETVRGAVDLEFQITKGQQDILNPRGVNVIRAFPGRGIYVWGARTLTTNTLWKYINVRRLFIFLEESVDQGTQFVVFEPNGEKLWGRVKATITQFLTRVWRDGALFGSTPDEAFFVKCDRTTMTADDINNGRLICVIGVAPVRPAEFVIFRFTQLTATD